MFQAGAGDLVWSECMGKIRCSNYRLSSAGLEFMMDIAGSPEVLLLSMVANHY